MTKKFATSFFVLAVLLVTCTTAYSQRVRLRSQTIPNCSTGANNPNWKFADIYADGNIAVQGSYFCRGAFIYDVSDPDHPVLASWYNPARPGITPPVFEEFLEAIVIGNRGYFGAGTNGGVHIVDLSDPYHPVLLGIVDATHGNGFAQIHEMMVFDQGGARYLLENFNSTGTRPLRLINITDPAAPVFKYEFNNSTLPGVDTDWYHAFHIRQTAAGTRMYASGWNGSIRIYDISDLATRPPVLVGTIAGNATNHSTWTSEDGNYLYSCRETQDGDLRVYDVHDPATPLLVRSMRTSQLGLNAITPHNPVVMGNYLYVSWYQAGIQVFDLTDPSFPKRIGQYDTFQPTFAPAESGTSAVARTKTVARRVTDAEPWDVICGGSNLQNALPTNYDGNWAVFPFLGQDKVLAGDLANGLIVLDASQVAAPLKNNAADFDGDRRTDLSVMRPASGSWQIEGSSGTSERIGVRMRLGMAGDEVVAGDYNGDGVADVGVFRPSTGEWFVRSLRTKAGHYLISGQYGLPNDIPVPGDFDADGRTDVALYRPSNMTFYIRQSTLGQRNVTLGNFGDRPVIGDYDGDGKADIAVWRPTTGAWVVQQSSSSIVMNYSLGQQGDRPVSADFDGNGVTDLVVFRPSTGEWLVRDPMTGSTNTYVFGTPEDVAIPADFDGDGKADLSVFRPSTNHWIRRNSANGSIVDRLFGQSGDTPVPLSVQPQ